MDEITSLAGAIAARALRNNIVEVTGAGGVSRSYLLAGGHQFRTLWARDLCFASVGATVAGHAAAVRDSLEALFAFQRPDGLLPRGLDNRGINSRVVLGLAGITPAFKEPLRPWFETEYKVISIDSNVIIPWAASRYIEATGDRGFAETWFDSMERAFVFLENSAYLMGDLIGNQPPYADWADSVQRTGRVAFTNVLYVMALRGAAKWACFLGRTGKASYYFGKAARANAALVDHFWDASLGALRNFDGDDRLTADANLMAIAQNVLPEPLARRAFETLRQSPLWKPMPGRATWPDYPSSHKGFNIKLVGIHGYHDSNYWLWLTAVAAMAARRLGETEEYVKIIRALSAQIGNDGDVYEILDLGKNGKLRPTRRLFYRAESPFTWSSGMYLEALADGTKAYRGTQTDDAASKNEAAFQVKGRSAL